MLARKRLVLRSQVEVINYVCDVGYFSLCCLFFLVGILQSSRTFAKLDRFGDFAVRNLSVLSLHQIDLIFFYFLDFGNIILVARSQLIPRHDPFTFLNP